MIAVGSAVMVTLVVAVTAAQPPLEGVVYVTVYVPAVEADGLMAPVEASMLKPDGDAVNVPFAKAPVPLSDTATGVAMVRQNGLPVYAMLAVGSAVMVTLVVAVTAAQPPLEGVVYVTVYVPAVEADGLMAPVEASMLKPDGDAVNVPFTKAPVPVSATATGVAMVRQNGLPVYAMLAFGSAVMVTLVVAVTAAHPPLAGVV